VITIIYITSFKIKLEFFGLPPTPNPNNYNKWISTNQASYLFLNPPSDADKIKGTYDGWQVKYDCLSYNPNDCKYSLIL
jgi:hypothetical protein